jgi:hypothetical protein
MMVGAKTANRPAHWESIAKQAVPLVKRLLNLNAKMQPHGYAVVGYEVVGPGGVKKKVLSRHKRIQLARDQLWLKPASTLKPGDRCWPGRDSDWDADFHSDPVPVLDVTPRGVYVTYPGSRDQDSAMILQPTDKVYAVPADWDASNDRYNSDEFWLKKADELGI